MAVQTALEIVGIVIPLIHGAGMVLAAHAALFGRTSQGAIAWALSLIFFPYAAVPLYLVFGRKKFYGYVEARRQGDRRIDHVADAVLAALRPAQAQLPEAADRVAVLQNLAYFPFTRGNCGRLLVDGRQTFDEIFAAIDGAQECLLVQFFIVRDDATGRALQERLIRRAAAGVRVYFLYDEIGSIRLPTAYTARLRQAGVHVQRFNTRRGWRNRFQINFRNHRKIVVADGRVAYVGGHNVGDEYLGLSRRFGHWRDTHVEVAGPAALAVQWSFLEDWHWATGTLLDLPPAAFAPPLPPGEGRDGAGADGDAIVISSGPADDVNTCTLMFLALISAARHRLWITSPYFVPDETVYDALQLAALRGVDVRIMLPAKPDHLLVYLSAFSYLESAENVGVKFYRYRAGFLHQKVLLVDDDLAAVGTANLDNRSMRLNFELTVLFADRQFAAGVAGMLQRDFLQCDRATPGDLKRRGLTFRLAVRIARLLSPIQ
jgi:cardiolipin synthase